MSQMLGRYTLLGKLATGGMADVFLARLDGTSGFERRVVIKRVLPQYASQPEFLKLFEQEARFASLLSHPHIATVSDFGVDPGGAAYLVMEHVDGASLRSLLREVDRRDERPDARLIARVFSQIAEALAAVHAAVEPTTGHALDLVHRDMSPENVLLSRQGAVKLADFGIARAMNEVSTTSPEVVRGKLRYMAPEQIMGGELSPAVDVWALGVSAFESLVLRRPFPEENEAQLVHSIASAELTPLSSLRSDLPPELVALIERCLRKDPRARPECQDLALEFERVASAGGSSLTARVIGNWVERLTPPAVLQPLSPSEAPLPLPSSEAPLPPLSSTSPEFSLEPGPDLDLYASEPREPAPEMAEQPQGRARWPLVVGLVLSVLLVGGGFAYKLRKPETNAAIRQVLVTSSPAGATVKYGETVLGTTPWAGDLPSLHAVELELSAPGFQAVKRTLAPGDLAPVEVVLKKAR